jgi:hypothetical protein
MCHGADVEVIPGNSATYSVIGKLRQPTHMIANTASDKNACLVERQIVIRRVVRCWWGRLVGICVDVRRHRHRRYGRCESVAGTHCIAFELELAPEGRQMRSETTDVASCAWLPRLFGECRDGESARRRYCKGGNAQAKRSNHSQESPLIFVYPFDWLVPLFNPTVGQMHFGRLPRSDC